MRNLAIVEARHIIDYRLAITFADGHKSEVDILPFLKKTTHPIMKQYLDMSKFKMFQIENDNVVWGANWDLIFPLAKLYKGKL